MLGERVAARAGVLAAGAILALCGACASGETMVLQNGRAGYSGCTAAAVGAAEVIDAGRALALRGSDSHVLLRFDLPRELASDALARARLEVFVQSVSDLRMICEIECRGVVRPWQEIAAAQGDMGAWAEVGTDYGRGRRAGVADSYELWEYDGEWFPHKYGFLSVPPGGKWIDFDITPLVRQWLQDPAANRGVALTPVDLPDRRFPNTARIEVAGPASAEADRRPRLALDIAPLEKPYLVGMTHTLRKFCDRSTRYRFFGPFEEHYELAMARNEFEGFQVVVYPMAGGLDGVTFDWTDLVDPQTGATIPRDDICYACEYVFPALHPNGKIEDWYFHGKNFAMPDPLVTPAPVDLPERMSTPFWFTVRTRPQTRPGTYVGTVTVRPANAPPRDLKLTVRVWAYAIPQDWDHEAMGQMVWDDVRAVYGEITPELKRRYIDFLLDHRFAPTEQYVDKLSPDLEDIPYCVERGMATIYLSGNFRGDTEALRERYDAVKRLGLIDRALVYIGDETNDWDEMKRRSEAIRRACPEAMVMIGGSFPRPELEGVIDVFDPQIDVESNEVYSLPADRMRPLIEQAKEKGEKFVWYVAAGPMLPCPNVQMEEPLIASRVLFWLAWKFGVTGFEYYCYNIWRHNLPQDGRRWPEAPFSPRGWGDTNGDGMLFYPGPEGPFSSVRFENIRDGIEDWESHRVLGDYVAALRGKAAREPGLAAEVGELLARAERVLSVPDEVARDFVNWTWEPDVLLAARRELGDTIQEMTGFVSEEEMLAARQARRAAERERRREMLRQRAAAVR